MGNGEWGVGSGEWGRGNGEWVGNQRIVIQAKGGFEHCPAYWILRSQNPAFGIAIFGVATSTIIFTAMIVCRSNCRQWLII